MQIFQGSWDYLILLGLYAYPRIFFSKKRKKMQKIQKFFVITIKKSSRQVKNHPFFNFFCKKSLISILFYAKLVFQKELNELLNNKSSILD